MLPKYILVAPSDVALTQRYSAVEFAKPQGD